MPRLTFTIILAAIIGIAVLMLAPIEHTGGQQITKQTFSDLRIQLDRRAALPKPAIDGRSQSEIALDRGFELYNARGRLNMRRGLNITLVGFPGENIQTETAGAEECRRPLRRNVSC